MKWLEQFDIILASQSPRRQQLLSQMGVKFRLVKINVDETPPINLDPANVVIHLSKLKARAIPNEEFKHNTFAITADTFVVINNSIIGKPVNRHDAYNILKKLSAQMHTVYSGITLRSLNHFHTFSVKSKVWFKKLDDDAIQYYVDNFLPLDKAGAYGIQEWIGLIGVKRIEGSYFNIMGLPTSELYDEMKFFVNKIFANIPISDKHI